MIALRSHNNAEAAIKAGKFKEEIVPVAIPQKKGEPRLVDTDEHVRFGLTMADLSRLAPAFNKDGTVTAGNSSGLNDGAAAVIVILPCSGEGAGAHPPGQNRGPGRGRCGPQVYGLWAGSGHGKVPEKGRHEFEGYPAYRSQRSLRLSISGLRKRPGFKPGDHQRQRQRYRAWPSRGGHRCSDHHLPDV